MQRCSCPVCDGSGIIKPLKIKCKLCNGRGVISTEQTKLNGSVINHYVKTSPEVIEMTYLDWLESKELIDKDIDGYTLEKSDYPTSNVLVDGKLTITYWYNDETVEGGWTEVAIPKTGQEYPKASYLAGILCFMIAILIMGFSYNSVKRSKKK